jgi:hypothetical protein
VLACGLARIDERHLPPLGFYEIELRTAPRATGPAIAALVEHIVVGFADGGGEGDVWLSQTDADSSLGESSTLGPGRKMVTSRVEAA